MDLKLKGISWVGNICQKFETMCMEMEDMVRHQEANFLGTAGVTVKKVYAEVVQDLLGQPSMNPDENTCDKIAEAETFKKTEVGNEKDPTKEESSHGESEVFASSEKDPSQASISTESHGVVDHLPNQSSTDHLEGVNLEESLENNVKNDDVMDKECEPGLSELTTPLWCPPLTFSGLGNEIHFHPMVSENPAAGSNVSPNQNNDLEMSKRLNNFIKEDLVNEISPPWNASSLASPRNDSSQVPLFKKLDTEDHEEAYDQLMNMPPEALHRITGECKSSSESGTCDNVSDLTDSIGDISSHYSSSESRRYIKIELAQSSSSILSAESNTLTGTDDDKAKSREEHNGSVETCVQTVERFDNVNLGESCIVVDKELFSISPSTGTHRSYKKKIKDAIASRMRSTKQREYEQLAIWYGDLDAEINPGRVGSSPLFTRINSLDMTLSNHDSCDSDWELL